MDSATHSMLAALQPAAVVEQFVEQYAPSTRDSYRRDLRTYLAWADSVKIHPLTASPTDINRYISYLQEQPWVNRTVARRYGTLRSFFTFVSQRWRVPAPTADRDVVGVGAKHPASGDPATVLSFDDFERVVLAALAELPLGHALGIALIAVNGLKPAEAVVTNVQDVHERDGQLHLHLTLREPAATTPLIGKVADLARKMIDGRSHGPLLLNDYGNRMTQQNLRNAIRGVAGGSDVDRANPQLLRNTAGVIAALDGASAHGLRQMLGISARRAESFLAHASALPEEHGAYRVWRRLDATAPRNELLEQVDRLLADAHSHPIAPIALAGAALEQHLRRLCQLHEISINGDPSIDRYKGALMREKLMTARTATQVDRWRQLRNDAAHGHDTLTHADAEEMARGVRAFIEGPRAS